LSEYVINPLWDANYLQLNKIRFDMEPPKDEKEDDDDEGSDDDYGLD